MTLPGGTLWPSSTSLEYEPLSPSMSRVIVSQGGSYLELGDQGQNVSPGRVIPNRTSGLEVHTLATTHCMAWSSVELIGCIQ